MLYYPTLTSSFISSLDWIKNVLFYCNLQETWQAQTVGNEDQFIEVLKEKVCTVNGSCCLVMSLPKTPDVSVVNDYRDSIDTADSHINDNNR